MRLRLSLVLAGVVMAALPGVMEGQSVVGPLVSVSAGITERTWDLEQKPPAGFVMFVWTPQRDAAATLYQLRGKCDIDSLEALPNKVVFQNILLWGTDNEAWIEPANVSRSIKKGEGKVALWDLTPQGQELAANSGVLVLGEFKVTKKLQEFDTLRCELAIHELFDVSNLRLASTAERLDYFREVERQRGEKSLESLLP